MAQSWYQVLAQKYLKDLLISNLLIVLRSTILFQKRSLVIKKTRLIERAMILLFDNMRKAVDEGHIVGLFYINLPETFAVDEFRIVGVLHVNLSKAFDTLSHSSLLEKLKSFGITDDSHT